MVPEKVALSVPVGRIVSTAGLAPELVTAPPVVPPPPSERTSWLSPLRSRLAPAALATVTAVTAGRVLATPAFNLRMPALTAVAPV